jgi:hypothetical protein
LRENENNENYIGYLYDREKNLKILLTNLDESQLNKNGLE